MAGARRIIYNRITAGNQIIPPETAPAVGCHHKIKQKVPVGVARIKEVTRVLNGSGKVGGEQEVGPDIVPVMMRGHHIAICYRNREVTPQWVSIAIGQLKFQLCFFPVIIYFGRFHHFKPGL